jgi:two-component system response regulator RegA
VNYLLVDDDPVFTDTLSRVLERRGLHTYSANDGQAALNYCTNNSIDRVILDLKLAEESGLSILTAIKEKAPSAEVLILTGYSSILTAVEAIKLGAINYLCKPASADQILAGFDSSKTAQPEQLSPSPPSVGRLEWEHIQRVMADNNGNISATARSLGMHRRTLQRKLQKRPVKN